MNKQRFHTSPKTRTQWVPTRQIESAEHTNGKHRKKRKVLLVPVTHYALVSRNKYDPRTASRPKEKLRCYVRSIDMARTHAPLLDAAE